MALKTKKRNTSSIEKLSKRKTPRLRGKRLKLIDSYMVQVEVYEEVTPDNQSVIIHRHEMRLIGGANK